MSGAALADNLALVLAVWALAGAASRVVSRLVPDGLARALAVVVCAAAVAVLESLVLGRVGLGGSPLALTLLALATWLAAVLLCPRPLTSPGSEVLTALRSTGPVARLALGATLGALGALVLIQLHRPTLGQDAITYHLPEVLGWVQSGHTARVLDVFYGLPVGNYPITEEVLLTWATGIAHGFAAPIILTIATVPVLLGAGWLALTELGVPPSLRALALGALTLAPLIVAAWVQPGTDLQAMTWLACCGALCLAARRHPGLLAIAVVAAGLAVGTKTTVLSYSVVMLLITVWFQRAQLRPHWRALTAALVLAVLTGVSWYLRNWVDHGSPLWPFSSFPSGDPRPAIIDYLSTSLLHSLQRTLLDHLHGYLSAISGAVVLVVGGALAILPGTAMGRRRLLAAGLVVLLGALEYSVGPVTGLPPGGTVLVGVIGSTLRYLMPVFAAGAVALALAAADPNRLLAGVGCLALVGAVVWDLITDLPDHLFLAFDSWLWPGIVVGAVVVLALGSISTRVTPAAGEKCTPQGHFSPAVLVRAGTGVLAGVLAALVLAAGSTHFQYRQAVVTDYANTLTAFLLAQPGYADTHAPVATSKTGLAPLAGDRLQHPLSVIAQDASCASVDALHARAWIVVAQTPQVARHGILARVSPAGTAGGCLTAAHAQPIYDDSAYAVYAPLKP